MDVKEIKDLIIKAGHKLIETGLIVRTWGNISCRVDNDYFAVTPRGRSYLTLTPDEIVIVKIKDCSYDGDIEPSSERGIHAEVYKSYPHINFLIHTHQEYASIISAADISEINLKDEHFHPYFGEQIICADYALPGTKKLRKNVKDALSRSESKAVIMKNHGALCLGKDYNEAFSVAFELEKACLDYILKRYYQLSGKKQCNMDELCEFALSLNYDKKKGDGPYIEYANSERTKEGFILYNANECEGNKYNKTDLNMSRGVTIHKEIYNRYKNINNIIFKSTPEIKAICKYGIRLRPLLDDFAQIAGCYIHNEDENTITIAKAKALRKSSVVLLKGGTALCCGKTKEDALAAGMITEKNCKAYIGASLFGKIKPIKYFECLAMRSNYLKKYSKLGEKNKA